MPKTKISEYSTTNSDNTDIESINIAEGCAPSGINNAIRELMVHLKEFQTGSSGDPLTVAGAFVASAGVTANTLTLTGILTASGGTIMSGTNTMSGSNIISGNINSSGTTNTFSGGNIFSGTNTISGSAIISGNINSSGTNTFSGSNVMSFGGGTSASPSIYFASDTNTGIFSPTADTVAVATGGSERVRVDSSGNVGIGTNSPGYVLEVYGATNASQGWNAGGTVTGFAQANTSNADFRIGTITNHALGFYTNSIERARIDSSGNVGIGTSSPGSKLTVAGDIATGINSVSENFLHAYAGGGYKLSRFGVGNKFFARSGDSGDADSILINDESNGFTTLKFFTSATERARISGYALFLNYAQRRDTSFDYSQFVQTDSGLPVIEHLGKNASYAGAVVQVVCSRAATNSYQFLDVYSGNAGDLEFRLTGDGNGKCDGSWTGGGADYAEYFESANGHALTLGATVVLDNSKVREATDQDPASAIIGVVRPKEPSKASAMIGNAAWNKWAKKYLTDDFDRYIMEDHDVVEWEETITDEEGKTSTKQHSYESHNIPAGVTVPTDAVRKTHDDKGNKFQHYKLNPAWDKDAEYVNRENRPEWNIIGLLGQVKILKGQPVGDRWIKMRDVSATVEEWMIR